jgi:phosphoribosylformylglycinamidine synthase subunit PurQ / glutaminase
VKFGVVVFPGSNCDADAYHACTDALGQPTTYLWHKDHDLKGVDCVILPGGFSYGDYLRSGAIARFSPLMRELREFADKGGLVLGICNGFQVLLELALLPGAMLRNKNLKFLCQYVTIRLENEKTPFTRKGRNGQVLNIPIAHFDGNWYAPPETLKEVEDNGQVVFRYCDPAGALTEKANVNGSLHAIAGLCNKKRNVMGMMPHPERAVEPVLGSVDGLVVLQSLLEKMS